MVIENTFASLKQYKTKRDKMYSARVLRQRQILKRCIISIICVITVTCCSCGFAHSTHHNTNDVRYTAGVASIMD